MFSVASAFSNPFPGLDSPSELQPWHLAYQLLPLSSINCKLNRRDYSILPSQLLVKALSNISSSSDPSGHHSPMTEHRFFFLHLIKGSQCRDEEITETDSLMSWTSAHLCKRRNSTDQIPFVSLLVIKHQHQLPLATYFWKPNEAFSKVVMRKSRLWQEPLIAELIKRPYIIYSKVSGHLLNQLEQGFA